MQSAVRYVVGYTTLLLVFGFFLVAATVMMFIIASRETETGWALRMAASIEALMAAGCLVVAVLRARGSPIAAPATAAISIILSLSIPFGTAAFIWWLVSVRKQEAQGAS